GLDLDRFRGLLARAFELLTELNLHHKKDRVLAEGCHLWIAEFRRGLHLRHWDYHYCPIVLIVQESQTVVVFPGVEAPQLGIYQGDSMDHQPAKQKSQPYKQLEDALPTKDESFEDVHAEEQLSLP
ncbi:MAG: hypothetical protein WA902_13715, partial [Thermosynechococcaceae cyanobacterium]